MRPWVSSVACIAIAIAIGITAPEAAAQSAQVKRGLYLVNIGGCNDCHTPGSFSASVMGHARSRASMLDLRFPAWACLSAPI